MTTAENKPTVLLVDDDEDFLIQQKLQLEAAGFRVVSAPGQTKAEELLANQTPDLAILDLMMEHADGGFTLCHHIRKKYPSIPIIMVSSVNSETGMEFGTSSEAERSWIKADCFLAKPIRFEQLKIEIDRLLKGST
jgi:DNA-binding response OmpR family regulator